MWPRRTPVRSAICDLTRSMSEICERTCWIKISPAVESRTPLGSRSKIGTPRSCSMERMRRFSAVEVIDKASAALRIDPAHDGIDVTEGHQVAHGTHSRLLQFLQRLAALVAEDNDALTCTMRA